MACQFRTSPCRDPDCLVCESLRESEAERERVRLRLRGAGITVSMKRPPSRWRCCGLLQAIDPDTPPVCARCGETPMWARPEPDLRHFRVGR